MSERLSRQAVENIMTQEEKIAELESEVAKLKAGLAMCAALPLENSGLRAENARLRDLLRWRKTSEEPPQKGGQELLLWFHPRDRGCGPAAWVAEGWRAYEAFPGGNPWPFWRPLGPLPGDTTGGEE